MDTIDAILSSASPQVKNKPFESLHSLYQRVLDSAAEDDEDKALVETIFSVVFVVWNRQPLTANAIADILFSSVCDIERTRKREWVESIVTYLFAIVHVEEGTKAKQAEGSQSGWPTNLNGSPIWLNASASQSTVVQSEEPEVINLPSREHATDATSLE